MNEYEPTEIESGGKGKGIVIKELLKEIGKVIDDDKKYSWKIKFKEIKGV
jgi:hypothetical protein